jgi:hypothetical protein
LTAPGTIYFFILEIDIVKPSLLELITNFAGTNHSAMDQNSLFFVNKENIQPAADGDHSHGGSTMTTMIGSRISMASGKYQLHNLLFIFVKEPNYLHLYCNKKDNADGSKITNYIER